MAAQPRVRNLKRETRNLKPPNIAVVGATGQVGRTLLRILEERQFSLGEVRALASARSEGKALPFRDGSLTVHAVGPRSFDGMDLAFFDVPDDVSRELAPLAVEAGTLVVDKSAAWRMEPDVPLVVPEVNAEDARAHHGIIAVPNCSTIQMVVTLAPIHRINPITRVIVDSYQSVSGAGAAAVDELWEQIRALAKGHTAAPSVHPHPIAMNVLPQIGSFRPNGYCSEEMKLVNETHKIMHAEDLAISATTVRVPVEVGHAEAIHVELSRPMSAGEVRTVLAKAPGVAVIDEPLESRYPLPLMAAGRDEVFVGRIRADISHPHGVAMWVVSDNLRKGAALNGIQIAEWLLQEGLL